MSNAPFSGNVVRTAAPIIGGRRKVWRKLKLFEGAVARVCVSVKTSDGKYRWLKLDHKFVVSGPNNFMPKMMMLNSASGFSLTVSGVDLLNYFGGQSGDSTETPEVKLVRPYYASCHNTTDAFVVRDKWAQLADVMASWSSIDLHASQYGSNPDDQKNADFVRSLAPGDKLGVCVNGLKIGDEPLVVEYDMRIYAVRIVVSLSLLIIVIFIMQYNGVGPSFWWLGFGAPRPPTPEQAGQCVVCWSAPRNVAFSCGHVSSCDACSPRLKQCPICRQPCRKKLRVYFP